MSYSALVSEMIKESGYSLRQFARICKNKYNVDITASYLSKLQKEEQTPASVKVNTAIAKVCNKDPEDLLFEADFERSPKIVKETVNSMVDFMKNVFIVMSNSIQNDIFKEGVERYSKMSTREFIQELSTMSLAFNNFTELNIFDKTDRSNQGIGDLRNLLPTIKENIENENNKNLNAFNNLFVKLSIGIKMLDNSMFPHIPQGAKVEIEKNVDIKNGDFIVAEGENDTTIIRKYIKIGNKITLLPTNNDFETITYNLKDIKVIGRVKSVTIDY